ncbi:PREDICTED: probable serine/threonine-protein kinase At1g54610 isoform X2 [Camelina sativa]|uniref:Probable serine/threonine-protein kinase At1g54610 isoform X2 n=1 Tax=Camelina sativa TaxID=90675 RepID=A0ABM0VK12_CAMSA|nr:PREDICTED: probable serine/threonine-protein kinase At1g54610 isoform X2 [Camelina sativa]
MGCVSSRHRPFRRKSSTLNELSVEKRPSSRIDSSRIEDWIQPADGFDRSSSKGDANVRLFSSGRFHDDHQIGKILEYPETVGHMDRVVYDQELRRASSAVADPDLEIDSKVMKHKPDRWNSRGSKVSSQFSDHLLTEREPEKPRTEASVPPVPRELKRDPNFVGPNDAERKQVAAGWPTWLVTVAGEALVGWTPRRANTFEKLEKIGQGTYSNVYRARDLLHNKIVALKKVRFDLNDMESVKFMAREIIVMRRLDHPNVLKLEGLITAPVSSSLYLVFEYMDHDLLGLSSLPGVKFSEPQVKCYMRQLLSGLEHCHSRGVLHRDIKGSNLLIDSKGVLKIADFGLATFFDPAKSVPLTSHVVTLWYRPPELLLGATHYGVGVDLWSTGCILGELYAGRPILPGKTEVEQLHKIFKLCGSPTENYWRKQKLSSSAGFITTIPYRRKVSEMFKDFPASVLSLLETLLSIDPDHRSSADCALESEYFKTKPFACDPSHLPKYPPSKEIDAKMRDEAKRRQPMRADKQERHSMTRRSHESKLVPPIKANHSLSMTMEKQYQDLRSRNDSFKSFKEERTPHGPVPDYLNMQTRNNQTGGRISYSGPLMSNRNMAKSTMHVKENAVPRYHQARVNQKMLSGSVSSKALLDRQDQQVMNQRRRDRRAPIEDPSWYTPSDSKIYMSGPLLAQPRRVDQMLEEHDRQLQQVNRQAQTTRQGRARNW